MDVNEVLLPGVGLRYEFTNHEGARVGVIARRSGEFELVVYSATDPDASRPVVRLNSEEADTLAEILGAPRIAERFADLTKEVPGLLAAQIPGNRRLSICKQTARRRGRERLPARPSLPLSAAKTLSPRRSRTNCSEPVMFLSSSAHTTASLA
jgi:hypothetical protein